MDILGRCCTRKRYTCHFNYCIPSFHDMDVGAGYYSEMGRFCYPTVDYRFNGLLLGPDHHILLLHFLNQRYSNCIYLLLILHLNSYKS